MSTTTQNKENIVQPVPLQIDLRDWFSGQALQAAVSGHIAHYGHDNHWPDDGIARYAYEIADAMIKARKAGA